MSRLFRFFQWNDMHMRDPFAVRTRRADTNVNEKAGWALSCAAGEQDDIKRPDFIVSAGDLVCGKTPYIETDYAFVHRQMLSRLSVPLLPCVGNHDIWPEEGDPDAAHAYDRWHGTGWRNYVFTCGGVGFVVMDTCDVREDCDTAAARRSSFVASALDFLSDQPVFVVTHYPLIPMRRPETLNRALRTGNWMLRDTRLLETIEAASDRVLAVLCGHVHLTSMRQQNGVCHIMPAGTTGYPADFAAFDVYTDHITVQMHSAPPGVLGDQARDDLHGRGRKGEDLCDEDYPDHETYVHGKAEERSFTIPLPTALSSSNERIALGIFHTDESGHWHQVREHMLSGKDGHAAAHHSTR